MSDIHWFKGKRRYIQAADLVGLAITQLPDCEAFDFASRKMADHPVSWVESGSVDKQHVVATFHATMQETPVDWVAVQDHTREILQCDDFDEDRMFAASLINDQTLTAPLLPAFTPWEHISSLNKLLLTRLFGHPSWWFVRLTGDASTLQTPATIRIRYREKKRILLRSEVYFDDVFFGMVDFAQR